MGERHPPSPPWLLPPPSMTVKTTKTGLTPSVWERPEGMETSRGRSAFAVSGGLAPARRPSRRMKKTWRSRRRSAAAGGGNAARRDRGRARVEV